MVSRNRIVNKESNDDIFTFSIKVEFSELLEDSDDPMFYGSPRLRDNLFFDYGVLEYVISYKVGNSTDFNFRQFKLIAHQNDKGGIKQVQLIDFVLEKEGIGKYTINLLWFFENYHKLTTLLTNIHQKIHGPNLSSKDRFYIDIKNSEYLKNKTVKLRDAIFYNSFVVMGRTETYNLCYENLKQGKSFDLYEIDTKLMEFLVSEGISKKTIFKFIKELYGGFFSENRQFDFHDNGLNYPDFVTVSTCISDILEDVSSHFDFNIKDLIEDSEDKILSKLILSKIDEYLSSQDSSQYSLFWNYPKLHNLGPNIHGRKPNCRTKIVLSFTQKQ